MRKSYHFKQQYRYQQGKACFLSKRPRWASRQTDMLRLREFVILAKVRVE
jgi:hypothetical protein